MVSARLEQEIRRELEKAANAKSVGEFHQQLVEVFARHRVILTITRYDENGDIHDQFRLLREAISSVLHYQAGRKGMVHISQSSISQLAEPPSGDLPHERRLATVYDLLSSAMRAAKGESTDVTISF